MVSIHPVVDGWAAEVRGVDLSRPLGSAVVQTIRDAWLAHHVLSFPGQSLSDDDLERFTLCFGPFGEDPFIAPIPGRRHVIAVERGADETGPVFAESWHTDWSFLEAPPSGTCLYGLVIPPQGGDTVFANQHMAFDALPESLRLAVEGRRAIHSARAAYAPGGVYGDADTGRRSMDIRPSETANRTRSHPIVRVHPETGRPALFGCAGYVIGVEDMEPAEAITLLGALYQHHTRPEFQHRHRWRRGDLLMWDNRSVLHMATGGYQGHRRLLHRTTIGAL